MGATRLRLE